jgi:superfamily I DNA/RNA helicase
MEALSNGRIAIPHTNSLVRKFNDLESEVTRLSELDNLQLFIDHWLDEGVVETAELKALAVESAAECESIDELLSKMVEQITQPEIPMEVADVRIMSLHRSKGLSSPVVFICGCVEGLHPSMPDRGATPNEQARHIEEQRRLFYVGLTRVKADPPNDRVGRLYLTSARTMDLAAAMGSAITPAYDRYGTAYVNASRFFDELGPSAPDAQAGG